MNKLLTKISALCLGAAMLFGAVTGVSKSSKEVKADGAVTLAYSGSTTGNMTGNNDATTLGLNSSDWSVVGDKGGNGNFPGLNKAGQIRLYGSATNHNFITVTATAGQTITSAVVTYGASNYNALFKVNDSNIAGTGTNTEKTYSVNSNSFAIYHNYSTSTQVYILSIRISFSDDFGNNLDSISLSGQTTEYYVGDTFSFDGVCTATYDDGSTEIIANNNLTVSNPDMSTAGTKTIIVEYSGKTASYDIDVLTASPLLFNFGLHSAFSSWTTSYTSHELSYEEVTFNFSDSSKQTVTITDAPVARTGTITAIANGARVMTSTMWKFRQWSAKPKTILLKYSTDRGASFNDLEPAVSSSTFSIPSTTLPEGTNALQISFDNTSNQVGIVGCNIDFEAIAEVPVTAISFTSSSGTVEETKTLSTSITFTPSNTTQLTVSYSSSDNNIATVDNYGVITGIHAGTATITVTSSSNSSVFAQFSLTVTEASDLDSIEDIYNATIAGTNGSTVYNFRGYVVASFYNNLIVQNGNYGITVYGNVASSFSVGDKVTVRSATQLYKGMVETKGTPVVSLYESNCSAVTPVNITSYTDFTSLQHNVLVSMNNLVYRSTQTAYVSGKTNGLYIFTYGANELTIKVASNPGFDSIFGEIEYGTVLNLSEAVMTRFNDANQLIITDASKLSVDTSAIDFAELFLLDTCENNMADWDEYADSFSELSAGAQDALKYADSIGESSVQLCVERYDLVMTRYTEYADFMSRNISSSPTIRPIIADSVSFTTIIVIVAIASITVVGALVIVRKRKEN